MPRARAWRARGRGPGWCTGRDPGYAGRVGPYREADASESFEVDAREGRARLELGPRWFRLGMGERLALSVAEDFATVVKTNKRRRRKQRSLRLGHEMRLLLARGVPTNDIGIWYEGAPGVAERLIGLRPPELLDDAAMRAWQVVDRMAQRLRAAVAPHSPGVERAIEVGQGADRVLIVDFGEGIELYVRRLFRERARRAMTVYRDGTVMLMVKNRERRIQCHSRYGVTVLGDYIRFADPTGEDLGALSVPWVTPEDRKFVVHLIGQLIEPNGPHLPAGTAGAFGSAGSIASVGAIASGGPALPVEPARAREPEPAAAVGPLDGAEPEGAR